MFCIDMCGNFEEIERWVYKKGLEEKSEESKKINNRIECRVCLY